MGFGFSLALTAAGAILAWAVHASSSAFDVNTVGYILFGVGLAGIALSIAFWSSWGGPGSLQRTSRTIVDPSSGTRTTEESTRAY